LMALAVPPLQAAAILLPLLVVMDAIAMWSFRGQWDMPNIRIIVPGAVLGVVVGTFTFRHLSDDAIRILIALIALIFSVDYYVKKHLLRRELRPHQRNRLRGTLWGVVAGFTSFGIHQGAPPLSVYLLPQRLEKKTLMATFALFFGVINWVKLVPYTWLGQLDVSVLMTSAVLLPLAPVGVRLGYVLLHKVSETFIYEISYLFLVLVGIKLMFDGLTGILGA
ncbi:MAG: sulfite exporter TauE/SafE family protein, partial [bacterium]